MCVYVMKLKMIMKKYKCRGYVTLSISWKPVLLIKYAY